MSAKPDIFSRFEIHIDAGEDPVFKEGDIITGRLVIELRKPMTIKEVKVKLKGSSAWLNDSLEMEMMEKSYVDEELVLEGPGQPEPEPFQWIADFTYSWPIKFEKLPTGCPSTYEGAHGFIRYLIRASLVQEDEFDKIQEYYVKKAFNVILPSDGHIVTGKPAQTKHSVFLGKCHSKKLTVKLSLEKTGFLPGEDIHGNLRIGSMYPKDILHHMEARLVDRVRYFGAEKKYAASPWRTLLVTELKSQHKIESTAKAAIELNGLFLLTVPPVSPSTEGDHEDLLRIEQILSPYKKHLLKDLDGPSPRTVRLCKVLPFKIEYAIQVSLGTYCLLEIPIEIGELSTRDEANTLEAFVGGTQVVEEAEEIGKIAVNGPFVYTPVYPYPKNDGANGKAIFPVTNTDKSIHSEPEKANVRTEHPIDADDDVSKTMEQTDVEDEHAIARSLLETTAFKSTRTRKVAGTMRTSIVSDDDTTIAETSNMSITEISELPKIFELVEDEQQHDGEFSPIAAEPTETSTNENGEETIVTTEITEDGGTTIIKTTTLTKHDDGSESSHVQEQHTTT